MSTYAHVLPTLVNKTPTVTTFSDVDAGNFFATVDPSDPSVYLWHYTQGPAADTLFIKMARRYNAKTNRTNFSWTLNTVIRETGGDGLVTDHPMSVTMAVNFEGLVFPNLTVAKQIIEASLGLLVAGSLAGGLSGDNESTLIDKVDRGILGYTCI